MTHYIMRDGFYEEVEEGESYTDYELDNKITEEELDLINKGLTLNDVFDRRIELEEIKNREPEEVEPLQELPVEDEEDGQESSEQEDTLTEEDSEPKTVGEQVTETIVGMITREIRILLSLPTIVLLIPITIFIFINHFFFMGVSGIIISITGISITPMMLTLLSIIYILANMSLAKIDKQFDETALTKEETQELKEQLIELSNDSVYRSVVKRTVFYRQSDSSPVSSYAYGFNKVSLHPRDEGTNKLGVITHELAHLYYRDGLLTSILVNQYNLLVGMTITPWRLFLEIFIKKNGDSYSANPIIMILHRFNSFVETVVHFTTRTIMTMVSRPMEYRADEYTLTNQTHEDLINLFESLGEQEDKTKTEKAISIFKNTHPEPHKRVTALQKLADRVNPKDFDKHIETKREETNTTLY